jgi:hypothetical protein
MPLDEDIKIPTQPGAPTSEHGQLMFAMGQMVAQIKGLKDAQIVANGRTGKLEGKVELIEKWQNTNDGAQITWGKIGAFLTVLIAAIALIVKLIK